MIDSITIATSIISLFVGWGIAHLYFKKTSTAEKMIYQVQWALRMALFPFLFPSFFHGTKGNRISPSEPPPKDTDIPHVDYVLVENHPQFSGKPFGLLIKVIDLGHDLDISEGVSATIQNGTVISKSGVGVGFVYILGRIDKEFRQDVLITIDLQDMGKNKRGKPNHRIQELTIPKEMFEHDPRKDPS